MKTMSRYRSYMFTAIGVAIGTLMVVLYIRFLRPAHAKSIESACKAIRFQEINPTLGAIESHPMAPSFKVQNHKGQFHSLEDFKGKYVLLNFWASWCGTCRSEKQGLENLYNDFASNNLEVLALAADEDWNAIKGAMPDGSPLKIYLDPPISDDRLGEVGKLFGITGVPETFLINPKGQVIAHVVSRRDWNSDVMKTCLRSKISQ